MFLGRYVGKSISVAKNMRTTQPFTVVKLIYHPVTAPSFFSFILDQDFMAQKKTWAYEQVDSPNVGKHKQASLTGH